MHQRPIVGASKTGSISRLQARTAAKAVKIARATGGAARKSTSQSVTATVLERYLGHFGVGRSRTVVKNRTATKASTKDGRKEDAA